MAIWMIYFRTKVLHGPVFVVIFEVPFGTYSGENLILRLRNLSKVFAQISLPQLVGCIVVLRPR